MTTPKVHITPAAAEALGANYATGNHALTKSLKARVAKLLADERVTGNARQALVGLDNKMTGAELGSPPADVMDPVPEEAPVVKTPKPKGAPVDDEPGDVTMVEGIAYRVQQVPVSELAVGDGIAVVDANGSVVSAIRVDAIAVGTRTTVEGHVVEGRGRGRRTSESMAPTDPVYRLRPRRTPAAT